MIRREPLTNEQRRLLKIAARMPLASVANLPPVLGLDEERVRRMLGALRRGGWVTSVVQGMTTSRSSRPIRRVAAKPAAGSMCTSRTWVFTALANSRQRR